MVGHAIQDEGDPFDAIGAGQLVQTERSVLQAVWGKVLCYSRLSLVDVVLSLTFLMVAQIPGQEFGRGKIRLLHRKKWI